MAKKGQKWDFQRTNGEKWPKNGEKWMLCNLMWILALENSKQATKQASSPHSGAFGTRVVVGEAWRPATGRPEGSVSPCEGSPARILTYKWLKMIKNSYFKRKKKLFQDTQKRFNIVKKM